MSIPSEVEIDKINTIPEEYKPTIYKINVSDKKIYDVSPSLSSGIDLPKLSLGFQQYLHANIVKMEIIKEFEKKKKVYSTMRLFNTYIDDHDTGIRDVTKKYFKLSDKDIILGNGFYKMWEILMMFDITKSDTLNSIHILDDGSLAQSVLLFRDNFSKNSQKDKSFILTPTKSINDVFEKTYNKQLTILQCNENLTQNDISKVIKNAPKKVDLVTAYGSPKWKYNILLEQELFELLIGEIVCALSVLSDGGHFICRFFETYTVTSCKLIYVLSTLFEEVYLFKPLTSHVSTSEKFLVCKKFSSKPKVLDNLNKLFKTINDLNEEGKTKQKKNSKLNITNIFPEVVFPVDYQVMLTCMNTDISNKQIININKIVSFINSQNYFGESYTDERSNQINASTYWINLYYPNKTEQSKVTKSIKNIIEVVLNKNNTNIEQMKKVLI